MEIADEASTQDLSEGRTFTHRWAFRFEEIAIILAVLLVPNVCIPVFHQPAIIVVPSALCAGLFLCWMGWSRKRRSSVTVVIDGDLLTVSWPHTRIAKRLRPATVRISEIASMSVPDREKPVYSRQILLTSEHGSARVPLRVIDHDLAVILLEQAPIECEYSDAALSALGGGDPDQGPGAELDHAEDIEAAMADQAKAR